MKKHGSKGAMSSKRANSAKSSGYYGGGKSTPQKGGKVQTGIVAARKR